MYTTQLTVTIDHINYSNHLGHDKLITMLHEARLRFFNHLEQTELEFFGIGLILKSLQVNYLKEVFHGAMLTIRITVSDIRRSGFTMSYDVLDEELDAVATAETVLIGFDYENRLVTALPSPCRQALTEFYTDA